jgi:hypothetical protein
MPDQLLSVICIICREGFIQQEQSWPRQQGAGKCCALSLTAGEHFGRLAEQMI